MAGVSHCIARASPSCSAKTAGLVKEVLKDTSVKDTNFVSRRDGLTAGESQGVITDVQTRVCYSEQAGRINVGNKFIFLSTGTTVGPVFTVPVKIRLISPATLRTISN